MYKSHSQTNKQSWAHHLDRPGRPYLDVEDGDGGAGMGRRGRRTEMEVGDAAIPCSLRVEGIVQSLRVFELFSSQ
ncbi:hypothetical protein HanIR_Chr16g0799701 [Helianthus annuus]|nr:hypothetical protein HanIR_Chr16g0799701 [Helianthus annuus]